METATFKNMELLNIPKTKNRKLFEKTRRNSDILSIGVSSCLCFRNQTEM